MLKLRDGCFKAAMQIAGAWHKVPRVVRNDRSAKLCPFRSRGFWAPCCRLLVLHLSDPLAALAADKSHGFVSLERRQTDYPIAAGKAVRNISALPWLRSQPLAARAVAKRQWLLQAASTDTVPLQMRLGRARLPECPSTIQEHRVFVAEVVSTDAPSRNMFDDIPKPNKTIARLGTCLGWDRETDRFLLNDRGRSPSGGAIEAFSAKNDFHRR